MLRLCLKPNLYMWNVGVNKSGIRQIRCTPNFWGLKLYFGETCKYLKEQRCKSTITAAISDENFSEYLIKTIFVKGKHGAANGAKTDINKRSVAAQIRSLGRRNNPRKFGAFSHIRLCQSSSWWRQPKMFSTVAFVWRCKTLKYFISMYNTARYSSLLILRWELKE